MIIDGTENKIPLSALKESKIIKETTETSDEPHREMTSSERVFNSYNKLSTETFISALLSLMVDYADANGISEKELVSRIGASVNSPLWGFERMLIEAMNNALKKGDK